MAPRTFALAVLLATGGGAAADDATLQQCAAVGDPAARLACYDALAGRAPDPAAPVAAPGADFGKPAPVAKEAESLSARVAGKLNSWGPGTMVKLDNGQTWKVVGDENGYYPSVPENPEVVITRGFLGAYWLEIKAINRRIKVRRIS